MELNDAFKRIVRTKPGINQAAICSLAGINQGQFSRWLRSGSDLSEEKIGCAIHRLLNHCKTVTQPEIRNMLDGLDRELQILESSRALRSYQSRLRQEDPLTASSPFDHAHIRRAVEDRLSELIQTPPFEIAVSGGPKTGKSNVLEYAVRTMSNIEKKYKRVRKGYFTLHVDFRPFSRSHQKEEQVEALFRWLGETCQRQIPGGHLGIVLKHRRQFPEWVRANILSNARGDIPVLIFDHCDDLELATLTLLGEALHTLSHIEFQRSTAKLNILLAYDETSGRICRAGGPGSYFSRNLLTLSLTLASQPEINNYLKPLRTLDGRIDPHLEDFAWDTFCGHPYLTRLWAGTLYLRQGISPEAARDHLIGTLREEVVRPLYSRLAEFHPSWQSLLGFSLEPHPENAPTPPFPIDQANIRATFNQWLVDSGLFRWRGNHVEDGVLPTSPWIRQQLATALAKSTKPRSPRKSSAMPV
ncbi:MAG: ATP-binding protein [Magnetococcales bacterium]|nr:ATP-binding protein [Magnetococcales bacterium]